MLHLQGPTKSNRHQRPILSTPNSLHRPLPPRQASPSNDRRTQMEILRLLTKSNTDLWPWLRGIIEGNSTTRTTCQRVLFRKYHLSTDEFVEMLLLDGCFIIELFRIMGNIVEVEDCDPLISLSWVYSFFLRDLVRLENQIPFFILQS